MPYVPNSNEMLSADQGKDISSTVDPDKARLPFVLRLPLVLYWLQRYLENHPDDRDVVLKAVTVPKVLLTPASTPSNTDIPGEPAPAPIPSQFIEQEVESNSDRDADQHASPFIKPHDQSSRAVDNRDESLFVDPHDHSSLATQQGGGHGVPPYQAYVEDAEDSSGDSQPSANLDDWIPSCDGDDRQDGLSSGDSQHAANLDDLLPSSNRQDGLGIFSVLSHLATIANNTRESLRLAADTHEHNPSAEHNIAFADLPADLRAKAQMIGDIKTRGVAWHFFHYIDSWFSGPTNYSNAEPNLDDDVPLTSSSDQRLRELKVGIITQETTEKSIKSMKIVARVFKRVYLAELAHRYKEETAARKAEPKTRSKDNLRVLSVKNRYTNVLFPETITCEGKQQSKKKENGPRKKAKGKLELEGGSQRLVCPSHEHSRNGLPSKRIVLETYPSNQLSHLCNRPLKELFQFCTGTDSQRAYATAGPPLSQDPSNITYSEYPRPPAPQRGFIQQVDVAVEEPFYSQNGDLPVKSLGYYEGEPLVDTAINSYQLNTTGDMTADMSQGMGWTGLFETSCS
ncbi:hypothetical protein V501_09666 [Pseudogymnoascus sp. VKM F-4519 (FW-2642)]|nr:hypothetical protein V501_09666 [Pseudogymnoascus sp. VKM F-4519 (FW-2642)]